MIHFWSRATMLNSTVKAVAQLHCWTRRTISHRRSDWHPPCASPLRELRLSLCRDRQIQSTVTSCHTMDANVYRLQLQRSSTMRTHNRFNHWDASYVFAINVQYILAAASFLNFKRIKFHSCSLPWCYSHTVDDHIRQTETTPNPSTHMCVAFCHNWVWI